MPSTWDERQREQLLEIAARNKNEVCASYAVVSLGLQSYASNRAALARPDTSDSVEPPDTSSNLLACSGAQPLK